MTKRLMDIAASGLGLCLLGPLLVLLAGAVRLSSPGPILYQATRVGRHGRVFKLLKFRTMVVNADLIGPGVTGAADPRVTRVGRFLRRSKLDELPQLINVLRGEMSLVGPRPEDPRYVACYTDEQRLVLSVAPGITSPASVRYRREEEILTGDNWEQDYLERVMPLKLAIDLHYVCNGNPWRDLKVLWSTVASLVSR